MRTLFIAATALFLAIGCPGPDMDDYCGEPSFDDASWDDGSEATAAELRDGLLGLWQGTASFDGTEEPMTLVVNAPIEDPYLITYPDAGEGFDNMHVSDGCLDTLRVVMPSELILDDSGVDEQIMLELDETGFSAGWTAGQDIPISSCELEPCTVHLSFGRYNIDSDQITGLLRWVDSDAEGDSASGMTQPNIILTRVSE
jgi:hypothetical protein